MLLVIHKKIRLVIVKDMAYFIILELGKKELIKVNCKLIIMSVSMTLIVMVQLKLQEKKVLINLRYLRMLN